MMCVCADVCTHVPLDRPDRARLVGSMNSCVVEPWQELDDDIRASGLAWPEPYCSDPSSTALGGGGG